MRYDNSDNQSGKSVYALGAADGLWTGLIMGLCVFCIIMAASYPWLALPGMAVFIATPVVVWFFLRRAWLCGDVPETFSAVWLHGICIFLFGSLIMALIMYLTLRFITPGWIENQTLMAARQLAQNPATADKARVLQKIVAHHDLPTPIYTSVSTIWLVSFTGSVLSMFYALILTRTRHFKDRRNDYMY